MSAPARGFPGRGRGRSGYLHAPAEWRGTSVQACGLWPFAAGAASPMVGVPIGRNIVTGATLCADPISWFQRAKLIGNPSMFALGLPGLGKALSTDTVVPTPDGWSTMGDLQPGGLVFDENGKPTRVIAVSEVMTDRECMEVRFSDGARIIADAEHLWLTSTRVDRIRPLTEASRGRIDRPVGTDAELATVHAAQQKATPVTTTRRQLSRELGWPVDDWRAAARITRISPPQLARARCSEGLVFDRQLLLDSLAEALTRTWGAHNAQRIRSGPITTRQIAATLTADGVGRANHAIPCAPPLALPDASLPVPPRVLGLWLGDGTSTKAEFTTADPELLDDFRAAGYPVRHAGRYRYVMSDRARRVGRKAGPQTLYGALRDLGVLGNKHIPVSYLRAAVDQRRALLSGLLDTDGTAHPDGMIQYDTTSPQLAGDAHALACSLGYRARLFVGQARLNGQIIGPKFTVGFTTRDVVFGLERKRQAHSERRRGASDARTRLRYIRNVRAVESVPVRCIQVENESGMFLVGRECIATHNSSLVRRMALGLAGYGVLPLILGDLKPDYVDLIRALDGQVNELGRGRNRLNVLDPGEAHAAADRLTGKARAQVIADARGRRHTIMAALVTLMRGAPPTDHEESLLAGAIGVLDERHAGVPVIADLIRVLDDAPDALRELALDRGDMAHYRREVDPLIRTLRGMLGSGRIGEVFGGHTTTPMRRDRPVVFDISSIDGADETLRRAALLACWSTGFGAVEIAHALADAGLEPERIYLIVLDELWQALRGGRGLVDRVDALTRLNRQRGVGIAMISHTMADLAALRDEDDRAKARGFVERAGMVALGGLPAAEMPLLAGAVGLSRAEQDMLVSWQTPPAWDPDLEHEADPPGLGNFLVKVGGRPGLPVHVDLTDAERGLHDTNKRWRTRSQLTEEAA